MEHLAGFRSPEPEASQRFGFIIDFDCKPGGLVQTDPPDVIGNKRGARDDPEIIFCQPCDSKIALDAAARIEKLGIGDASGRLVQIVGRQLLKKPQGVCSPHTNFAEGSHVE